MEIQQTEYTPGPWHWEYHPDFPDKIMALSGESDVLICSGTDEAAFGIIGQSDAQLIASAPELLAGCQRLLDWYEDEYGPDYCECDSSVGYTCRACVARAAIAKATKGTNERKGYATPTEEVGA